MAKRCLELGNFFSFFSIMAALDNPQVANVLLQSYFLASHNIPRLLQLASLRRQPKALPDKVRRELAVLEAATDPSRNMKTYREQYVARALQPRLPFLPLHLKDLYFLRESLSTPPTMHQAQVLTRLVLDVLVWQPFRLRPDFGMQGYFRVSVPAATTASVKPKTADPVSSAPLSPTAAPPTQSVAVAAAAAAAAAPPARQPPPSPNDAMRSFALSNLTSPSVKRLVKSRRGSSGESSANTSAPTARRRPSSGTAAELQCEWWKNKILSSH